ncbi:hypothetical protein PIB30_061952 [Stylosanthes scabra]|uniref:Uncharacterized protein n=1 Tax=Stylosanthes scabra TaxID=79078 RepID=A0ABU6YLI1_9FABA|nr:hypothetical protein [Stylosanthes scabra]
MDIEKNRPHDIASLVNHQEHMVYLDKNKLLTHRFDVEKRDFFVLDSKNIVSPSDERSTMNHFAPKLDEFRKQIVAKILLSKDNEKRMETIRLLNEMRNIRHAAVLRSPYVQVSSADLYSK